MNCWHCNTELIWGGDHDIEEENEDQHFIFEKIQIMNSNMIHSVTIRHRRWSHSAKVIRSRFLNVLKSFPSKSDFAQKLYGEYRHLSFSKRKSQAGMIYLFSKEDKLDITKLEQNDIVLMNKYFESMGFQVNVTIFTIKEYLDNMKLPNYFLNQELIKEDTPLDAFYYETSLNDKIYRVYFNFLRV